MAITPIGDAVKFVCFVGVYGTTMYQSYTYKIKIIIVAYFEHTIYCFLNNKNIILDAILLHLVLGLVVVWLYSAAWFGTPDETTTL